MLTMNILKENLIGEINAEVLIASKLFIFYITIL